MERGHVIEDQGQVTSTRGMTVQGPLEAGPVVGAAGVLEATDERASTHWWHTQVRDQGGDLGLAGGLNQAGQAHLLKGPVPVGGGIQAQDAPGVLEDLSQQGAGLTGNDSLGLLGIRPGGGVHAQVQLALLGQHGTGPGFQHRQLSVRVRRAPCTILTRRPTRLVTTCTAIAPDAVLTVRTCGLTTPNPSRRLVPHNRPPTRTIPTKNPPHHGKPRKMARVRSNRLLGPVATSCVGHSHRPTF